MPSTEQYVKDWHSQEEIEKALELLSTGSVQIKGYNEVLLDEDDLKDHMDKFHISDKLMAACDLVARYIKG